MGMTIRLGASAAALLVAALLVAGCDGAAKTPKSESERTPAPDDTTRLPTGKPTDPRPAHEAGRVALDADLEWSAVQGATSYVVYLGTDPTPDRGEFQGEQAETSFDPEGLKYQTIYYWRVDSKNRIGTITGDAWKFTTELDPSTRPAKAASPMPADDATAVSRTTSLEWLPTPAATSYLVYLGTMRSLGSSELQGEQTGTAFEPDTALLFATTYYWRVDTRNAGGTTTGDVWSFTTEVQPPPKATGPAPVDGATGVGIRDDLEWSPAPGATGYVVYFGTTPTPGTNERRPEQTDTAFDPMLEYDTTYYWRVDTRNDGGTTEGDVWSFTTAMEPQ